MNEFEISFFKKEHYNETLPMRSIEEQEAYLRTQEQTELLFDKTISLAFELSDYLVGTEKMSYELITGKYLTGEKLTPREKYFHAITVALGIIYKVGIIRIPFEDDPDMKLIESLITTGAWTTSYIALTIAKFDKMLQNNSSFEGETFITKKLISLHKTCSELFSKISK